MSYFLNCCHRTTDNNYFSSRSLWFQVNSSEPSYLASASCPLWVVPPLGLKVLHPSPQNGTLFLQPNNTRLLLRVQSRYETKAFYGGSNTPPGVPFGPDCPQEFPSHLCHPGASPGPAAEVPEPSVYAALELNLKMKEHTGPVQVELKAHNNVTEASLTVSVQLEEPLRGLVVQPHPEHRVLMESVVVSVCHIIYLFFHHYYSEFVCVCSRATQPRCWKALIPLLSGRWTTNRFSPITTQSST